MRNIQQDIKGTIQKLTEMKGVNYIIKVNRGRNRIETIEGMIENIYPAIFTVRATGGELNTFSYADLLSKNIMFKPKTKIPPSPAPAPVSSPQNTQNTDN